MSFDALRVTPNSDGVTDIWYAPRDASIVEVGPAIYEQREGEVFYYALGNPQRTLRPNYDRHTEYPNLP